MNTLVIVPIESITTVITVIFMIHSFFSSLPRSRLLSLFLLSFSFTLCHPVRQSPVFSRLFFSFCWLSQGLVIWLRLYDPLLSQNPREFIMFYCYHYYYFSSCYFPPSFFVLQYTSLVLRLISKILYSGWAWFFLWFLFPIVFLQSRFRSF